MWLDCNYSPARRRKCAIAIEHQQPFVAHDAAKCAPVYIFNTKREVGDRCRVRARLPLSRASHIRRFSWDLKRQPHFHRLPCTLLDVTADTHCCSRGRCRLRRQLLLFHLPATSGHAEIFSPSNIFICCNSIKHHPRLASPPLFTPPPKNSIHVWEG